MFGRSFKISLVKDEKKAPIEPEPKKTPIEYVALATDIGKKVVLGTCIVIVTYAVATAAGQVTINALNPEFKQ